MEDTVATFIDLFNWRFRANSLKHNLKKKNVYMVFSIDFEKGVYWDINRALKGVYPRGQWLF